MTDNRENLQSSIKKLGIFEKLGLFGVVAASFYALGFTIVKTYIHTIGLDGMFWLTKEFYVDAGSNFILEMIRAPLLTPHLFLLYLILLYMLIPKEKNLLILQPLSKEGDATSEAAFKRNQWIKISVLFSLLVSTCICAINYDYLLGKNSFVKTINLIIFDPTANEFSTAKKSLTFFSFVTPLVIIFAYFLYRFYGSLQKGSRSRYFYQLSVMVYAIFLAIVPITYGIHLYDWKLVPIKDTKIIENVLFPERVYNEKDQRYSTTRIWLLGQFNDKYFFVTKRGIEEEGVIEVVDESIIKHLNFNPSMANSLKYEIEKSINRETAVLYTADESVVDFLGIDYEDIEE